jgi:endonuclease/exonuclease/phosphatase family metal-dependent hydrolase
MVARTFSTLSLLIAILIAAVVYPARAVYAQKDENSHHEHEYRMTVDESITPIWRELAALEDGEPRIIAALATEEGDQMDFVEDELIVSMADAKALDAFLARWQGKIVQKIDSGKESTPYAIVRINSKLADLDRLQDDLRRANPQGGGEYRISSEAGMRLFAAAAQEKAQDEIDTNVNWINYGDSFTPENLKDFPLLAEALALPCSRQLVNHIRWIRELVEGGPNAQMAEQQLAQEIGAMEDCRPEPPHYQLVENQILILPEADGGEELGPIILDPPANMPQGFSVEIVSALGGYTSQPPLGGTLYGGSVYLNSDGNQISLATQPTFTLHECARSETFTIRLRNGSIVKDFTIQQPIRLHIPGYHHYSLAPGANANIMLCAAGDRGAMNWTWTWQNGDSFPPAALSYSEDADGDLTISGPVQVTNYSTEGRWEVQQGNRIASTGMTLQAHVNFYEDLSPCGTYVELEPGSPYHCELSRPTGPNNYTWAITSGSLPPGLNLVQQGFRWYIDGTVAQMTAASTPVGEYPVSFRLSRPGIANLADRSYTFSIGVPFALWTQNTILRPNNPFVPNTGDDNEERTDMFLTRINYGDYDIVALQEVFDDDQRAQFEAGYDNSQYNLLWGPTDEASPSGEESGLGLFIKGDPNISHADRSDALHQNHYTEEFDECQGDFSDCLADKGFSVTKVPFGQQHFVYVVNTHLQAAYDSLDQHSSTRNSQLQEIMSRLSASEYMTVPVILLGDLNIVASSQEYTDRRSDRLQGWEDAVEIAFGNAAGPNTIDKMRNAYAFFWSDVTEQYLQQLAFDQGVAACQAVAANINEPQNLCNTPTNFTEMRNRLDYIMIRQGSSYSLDVSSVQMEDVSPISQYCRDEFPMSDYPGMQCYFSDHYGLSAEMRLIATVAPGHAGLPDVQELPEAEAITVFVPLIQN